MRKFMFLLSALPIIFSAHISSPVDVICEGNLSAYNCGHEIVMEEEQKSTLQDMLCEKLASSHDMPSFGVALHDEILNSIEDGIYLRLCFDKTYSSHGMNFDELLIKIEKNAQGLTLIRGNNCMYGGRCFYFELEEGNFDDVYDFLSEKPTSEKTFEDDFKEYHHTFIDDDMEVEVYQTYKEMIYRPKVESENKQTLDEVEISQELDSLDEQMSEKKF